MSVKYDKHSDKAQACLKCGRYELKRSELESLKEACVEPGLEWKGKWAVKNLGNSYVMEKESFAYLDRLAGVRIDPTVSCVCWRSAGVPVGLRVFDERVRGVVHKVFGDVVPASLLLSMPRHLIDWESVGIVDVAKCEESDCVVFVEKGRPLQELVEYEMRVARVMGLTRPNVPVLEPGTLLTAYSYLRMVVPAARPAVAEKLGPVVELGRLLATVELDVLDWDNFHTLTCEIDDQGSVVVADALGLSVFRAVAERVTRGASEKRFGSFLARAGVVGVQLMPTEHASEDFPYQGGHMLPGSEVEIKPGAVVLPSGTLRLRASEPSPCGLFLEKGTYVSLPGGTRVGSADVVVLLVVAGVADVCLSRDPVESYDRAVYSSDGYSAFRNSVPATVVSFESGTMAGEWYERECDLAVEAPFYAASADLLLFASPLASRVLDSAVSKPALAAVVSVSGPEGDGTGLTSTRVDFPAKRGVVHCVERDTVVEASRVVFGSGPLWRLGPVQLGKESVATAVGVQLWVSDVSDYCGEDSVIPSHQVIGSVVVKRQSSEWLELQGSELEYEMTVGTYRCWLGPVGYHLPAFADLCSGRPWEERLGTELSYAYAAVDPVDEIREYGTEVKFRRWLRARADRYDVKALMALRVHIDGSRWHLARDGGHSWAAVLQSVCMLGECVYDGSLLSVLGGMSGVLTGRALREFEKRRKREARDAVRDVCAAVTAWPGCLSDSGDDFDLVSA